MSGGYEKKDVDIKKLTLMSIVPALTVILSFFIVHYYFVYVQMQEEDVKNTEIDSRIVELRAKEAEILTSYGVADAEKNRYRIPVERAMQLVINESQAKGRAGK